MGLEFLSTGIYPKSNPPVHVFKKVTPCIIKFTCLLSPEIVISLYATMIQHKKNVTERLVMGQGLARAPEQRNEGSKAPKNPSSTSLPSNAPTPENALDHDNASPFVSVQMFCAKK